LFAPRGERVSSQRHVILPADQAAHAAERQAIHGQVASVAAPPNEAFPSRRNQLSVFSEDHSIWPNVEERIEDRRITGLDVSLVDTNRDRHVGGSRRVTELICRRARNRDGVRVECDIDLAQVRRTARRNEPGPHRIPRHERFRKHDQCRSLATRFRDEPARLLKRPFSIQIHRTCLNGGNPKRFSVAHVLESTATVACPQRPTAVACWLFSISPG